MKAVAAKQDFRMAAMAAAVLVAAAAVLAAAPAKAGEAHEQKTCAEAQAWFAKKFENKASFGEMKVKTTTGQTCTVSFGTYVAPVIPPQSPSLETSTCSKAQASYKQIMAGQGSSEIVMKTKDGKICALSYGK